MSSNEIIWTHKPIGWTPKDCVDAYKYYTGDHRKIAFAGRLDPMAYGLLPLVVIDNNTAQTRTLENEYKTYQFKVILGLTTDTYDILGLVTNINEVMISSDELPSFVTKYGSIQTQEYPPYSSKTVKDSLTGKQVQLWKLSLEGRLPEHLPSHSVNVDYIRIINSKVKNIEEVVTTILSRIKYLSPAQSLRQERIMAEWNNHRINLKGQRFQIIKCEAKVSSGTYIRGIGNMMGGVCYDINRIKFGDKSYHSENKFEYAFV